MIRKIILTALLLTAGLASAVAAAGPEFRVDNATFDGGDAVVNSKVNAVFTITNTGTDTLKITSLRAPCGCTVAQYDPAIAPGETGAIRPVVDLVNMRPGRMSRVVHITTNAPNAQAVTLTITANIIENK